MSETLQPLKSAHLSGQEQWELQQGKSKVLVSLGDSGWTAVTPHHFIA